ncbi:hypothetical protein [Vibrio rhodolitus]|uniref:hypothetical protein n=1 Tax=Vibrio rhodolitus TaxID=2231649 RepID=UPI000E0C016B|nr:hypothetical protein [Vibrio rhodolitus]
MLRLPLVVVLLTTLAGYQLTRVEGEIDDVEVKVSTKDGGSKNNEDYKFCPPGQAKKGNC